MKKVSNTKKQRGQVTAMVQDTYGETPRGEMNVTKSAAMGEMPGMPGSDEMSGGEMPRGEMSAAVAVTASESAEGEMPSGGMNASISATTEMAASEMPRGEMAAGASGALAGVLGQLPSVEVSGAWRLLLTPGTVKNLASS